MLGALNSRETGGGLTTHVGFKSSWEVLLFMPATFALPSD